MERAMASLQITPPIAFLASPGPDFILPVLRGTSRANLLFTSGTRRTTQEGGAPLFMIQILISHINLVSLLTHPHSASVTGHMTKNGASAATFFLVFRTREVPTITPRS